MTLTTAVATGTRRAPGVPGAVVLALVVGTVLAALLDLQGGDVQRAEASLGHGAFTAAIGAVVGTLGAVILWFRERHRIGILLAGTGALWTADGVLEAYAVKGLASEPSLPGTGLAVWFVAEVGSLLLVAVPLLLVLYPSGHLVQGRWRTVSLAAVTLSLALPLALLLAPDEFIYPPALLERLGPLPGPTLPLPADVVEVGLTVAQALTTAAMPLAAAVVFARHARASGAERTQLRWLLWAALISLLAGGVMLLDLSGPVGLTALLVALGVTSVSVVIGIVRPELGDIDALVGGTLVHAGIAASLLALDLTLLAVLTDVLDGRLGQREVTVLVLLVAVTAYSPLRTWFSSLVRRRFLGRRGERYAVVSTLAARLEESPSLAEQLPTLAAAVSEAFRLPYVGVEVVIGGGERLTATHGRETAATRDFPMAYRGEPIGTISLPDDGIRSMLSRRDRDLLLDVVRQAAIAVRSTVLAQQLQHAREQLVLAREEDRRRIRRDLHDGLGPVLGGVAMRLDAAGNAVAADPERSIRLIAQARSEITEALADVRRLVHGLRPPALDDLGLRAAIDQQAERARTGGLVVEVASDDLAGLPAAVEVAAYRIVSEALANVTRHAAAAHCTVRLSRSAGQLVVTVVDDGQGIAADVVAGVGLRSLRERAEELGGQCEVRCPATGGTEVRAWLPTSEGGIA
ncbi:sensor histidine kinase [Intrasporangium sp.]|uniref:sensor histidine kinase n=1 Tax=Intrasporangium sp. TaxID=1925024 RepID=UPI00293A27D8|nr:sensor histidine kinase [Intrasporangium sp.]MDV3223382.1 sensor histidine kinase [Intrasporangium sp.]